MGLGKSEPVYVLSEVDRPRLDPAWGELRGGQYEYHSNICYLYYETGINTGHYTLFHQKSIVSLKSKRLS